jgi:hypothetical protein
MNEVSVILTSGDKFYTVLLQVYSRSKIYVSIPAEMAGRQFLTL